MHTDRPERQEGFQHQHCESEFVSVQDHAESMDDIFVTTIRCRDSLLRLSASYGNVCSKVLTSKELKRFGQCATMRFECEEELRISWTASPRLPKGKLLVDYRLAHGALTTGLLPVQYERFSSVSGINLEDIVMSPWENMASGVRAQSWIYEKTHAHWCMKNGNSDPDNLRATLLNAVEHYKNHHDNCHEDSRCRICRNYEPSKVIIQSRIAERLLMVLSRRAFSTGMLRIIAWP